MYSSDKMGQDQLTLSVDGRGFINVSGRSTKLSTFPTHIIPMQYVGLKDTKGVGIFADDIIKITDPRVIDRPVIGKVVWFNLSWQLDDGCMLCVFRPDRIEVIGNIHANPKLVEAPKCQSQ